MLCLLSRPPQTSTAPSSAAACAEPSGLRRRADLVEVTHRCTQEPISLGSEQTVQGLPLLKEGLRAVSALSGAARGSSGATPSLACFQQSSGRPDRPRVGSSALLQHLPPHRHHPETSDLLWFPPGNGPKQNLPENTVLE